jgi:hypothetical protein
LTAKGNLDTPRIWATVYNRTALNLTDIDVEVTVLKKNTSRRFRLIAYAEPKTGKLGFIKPFSSDDLEAYIAGFADAADIQSGKWTWKIVQARGFR